MRRNICKRILFTFLAVAAACICIQMIPSAAGFCNSGNCILTSGSDSLLSDVSISYGATKSKAKSKSKKYVSRLWTKKKPVAHACGGIDGIHYTNSAEALDNAFSGKVKTIEADFVFSSDNILLCTHDKMIEDLEPITADEFKELKPEGYLTTMTAKELLLKLAAKKRYLIVDAKRIDGTSLKIYKRILRLCDKNGISWYKKYIIPQLYEFRDYKRYRKVYKFKYGIFTTYKLFTVAPHDRKTFRKVAKYCKKYKLVACTNKAYYTRSNAKLFKKYKVAVAVHTVNDKKQAKKLIKRGARYIFTDELYDL